MVGVVVVSMVQKLAIYSIKQAKASDRALDHLLALTNKSDMDRA
jgi:hypothetical protein